MSQVREELRASIAAQRELGRDFEPEIVEAFLDRLTREMDARVDARLATHARPAPPSRRGVGFWGVVLALGSMGVGIGVTGVATQFGDAAGIVVVIVAWTVIGVVNVAHALSRPSGPPRF